MKKMFVLLFVLALSVQLYAQGYRQGVNNLNIGVGLGAIGIEGDATLPPISVGLQFGLTDKISVGGLVGYMGSSYKFGFFNSSYEWTYSYILVGARGEYHFLEASNSLDAYGGLTLGYNVVSVKEPSNLPKFGVTYSAAASSLLFGAHIGARYALSKSLGVFGELGYGISYLTVGLNLKM